jgi:hypothetical protein
MAQTPFPKPPGTVQECRIRLALLVLVLGAAGLCGCLAEQPSRAAAPPDVLSCARDGWRYEFQTLTGRESLFEDCEGTRRFVDVAKSHPGRVAALRRALAAELGVDDLSAFRRENPDRDAVARLRAIGYL